MDISVICDVNNNVLGDMDLIVDRESLTVFPRRLRMKLQYAPADTLMRVVEDLRRVEAGSLSAFDFPNSPILHRHRLRPLSVGILEGLVEGHPELGSAREITTSQIFFIDTDLGFARTLSRWYRLGVPFDKGGH